MLTERHRRFHSFPLLSPTFRSHQLWTPLNLERVTINQRNYHGYLRDSALSQPLSINTNGVRVKKYGDSGFFLHKNIPVAQKYDTTSLSRSDVRPWDQLIPRPMTTSQILNKESHLPFPSQHPYTSHISQFAVFPESKAHRHRATASFDACAFTEDKTVSGEQHETKQAPTTVDAFVQTDLSIFDPNEYDTCSTIKNSGPLASLVKSKAFSGGARIEDLNESHKSRQEHMQPVFSLCPGVYRWDVSRAFSRSLKCSMTYPAPSTMYSPKDHPLVTPSIPLSSQTYNTLQSVNKYAATTTSYKEHFGAPVFSRLVYSREGYSHNSEHRGKYARSSDFSSKSTQKPLQGGVWFADEKQESPPQTFFLDSTIPCEESISSSYLANSRKLVDRYTQTDFELHEGSIEEQTREQCAASPISDYCESYLHQSSAESDNECESDTTTSEPVSSLNDWTRPYSKTEVLRNFHFSYPEIPPDIRQFSMCSGRRHVINGYHAYYWH